MLIKKKNNQLENLTRLNFKKDYFFDTQCSFQLYDISLIITNRDTITSSISTGTTTALNIPTDLHHHPQYNVSRHNTNTPVFNLGSSIKPGYTGGQLYCANNNSQLKSTTLPVNYSTSSFSIGNGEIGQQSTNRILFNKSKGVTLNDHSHYHQFNVNNETKLLNGNLRKNKPEDTQSTTIDSMRIYSSTSDHFNASIHTNNNNNKLIEIKHNSGGSSSTETAISNGHSSSSYLQQYNLIDSINSKDFDIDRRLIGSSPSHPSVLLTSSSPSSIFHKRSPPIPQLISYEKLKEYKGIYPKGIDRNAVETHLSDEEFQQVFALSRTAFYRLPEWKRNDLKRRVQLF
ncbi:unnamed protein product [Schistosoma turkestanicum]|nr:unnamed protein product [Schistosoma turkestanicum]